MIGCDKMGDEDSIVEKIKRVCRGCKFFSISIDGTEEYYECSNENRWIDLGYDEDDLFECPEICIIAIAKYSFEGNLIDVDLQDIYFDFKGCKWKEEKNG